MNNRDRNFGVSTNVLSVQYTQKYIVEMVIREYAFSANDVVDVATRRANPSRKDATPSDAFSGSRVLPTRKEKCVFT